MRKENIRNAFNSPMRPFVLATTSIGQEGLDFHNYCRVIMHWIFREIRLILSRERAELIDLSAWQSDRMLPINMVRQLEWSLNVTFGKKCLKLQKRKSRIINQNLYHSGALGKIRV